MIYSIAKRLGLGHDVKPSKELERSAEFLGKNPIMIIVKARLALLIITISSMIGLLLLTNQPLTCLIGLIPGIMVYYYFTEKPKSKALSQRIKALNHAPEIITTLGTSLELNPNLERAIKIIGESRTDRISRELSIAYKNSIIKGVPLKKSFNNIINDWGYYSNGFLNGANLINISLLERTNRSQTINQGINSFFNGLINDLKSYLARIKTHTLILFSIGTIMPLIIISMLPLISLLNISANPLIISGLLIANLLLLNYYVNYVLSKRPLSFNQVRIDEKNKFIAPAIPYSTLIGLIIASPSIIYYIALITGNFFKLPIPNDYSSMPLLIGLSVGLSVYYYAKSHSLMNKRANSIKKEQELMSIVYKIGSKLQEKRSFEDALKQVIIENEDGALMIHLRNAYNKVRDLNTSIEESLMNELEKTNSMRVIAVFKLIFQAVKQGINHSARGVLRIYEYFNQMIQAEKEHEAMMEQVLSMMKATMIAFAPIISGFIVVMHGLIESNVPKNDFINLQTWITPDLMILLLGCYTIGLVITLTRYQTRIKHGPDKVIIRHELSNNIMIALIVYLTTIFIGQFVFLGKII